MTALRWAGRQWPLVLVLVALTLGDIESADGLIAQRWWVLPGAVLLSALALISFRHPVVAAFGAAVVMVVWSAVLRLVDVQVLEIVGPLLFSETAALVVVIVLVVRRTTPRVAAGLIGVITVGFSIAQLLRPEFRAFEEPPRFLLGDVVIPSAFVLLAAIVAGWYLRSRDNELERLTRSAVSAARQRERVSLARELHDVVAHHVGVMVVQAQAAQAVAELDPGVAARVLPTIETSGRDALGAMRLLVATLRKADGEQDAPLTQTTDLVADLRGVTAVPPGGGTPVRLAVDLADPIPAEVATSVLRLVQESMTNARRHAVDAREIAVTVHSARGVVRIQVSDDGRIATASTTDRGGGGYGLVGMRERVQLLGGQFSAGRATSGGWHVAAEVPLRA